MVTAEAVWAALEGIPDPEIPVISLVDLGVIRSVDVSDDAVQVELTPTFLGCPALEAMVRAIESTVGELGAQANVEVVNDDSWSTDKITCAAARAASVAGAPLPLLRLEGHEAREHLRPDAVSFTPLLRELPAAVRAVQDDLD